ncbi:MAG: peptide deformylase [Alphaproteobacteria bacterium]
MALLPIILAPDPRLKVKCRPVERVDGAIAQLMDDMLETMYAAPGIGLSAPQVGVDRRIITVDIAREGEEAAPLRMANPEVLEISETDILNEEGCLSFPEHYADVTRPENVRVRYLDNQNEIREMVAEGLLATCIQHEIDHLDGILFVDHLTMLRRSMIMRKMQKTKRAKDEVPV